MNATRQVCFDPVRCLVTVDLGADSDVAVLAVNEATSHLERHEQTADIRYEAVHGSVLLLGPVSAGSWKRPAAVLVDLPDRQFRGMGTVLCVSKPTGEQIFDIEVNMLEGDEWVLRLHCIKSREFPIMAGAAVENVATRQR